MFSSFHGAAFHLSVSALSQLISKYEYYACVYFLVPVLYSSVANFSPQKPRAIHVEFMDKVAQTGFSPSISVFFTLWPVIPQMLRIHCQAKLRPLY